MGAIVSRFLGGIEIIQSNTIGRPCIFHDITIKVQDAIKSVDKTNSILKFQCGGNGNGGRVNIPVGSGPPATGGAADSISVHLADGE